MEPSPDQQLERGAPPERGADQLEMLRSILLGPQRDAIDRLSARLDASGERLSRFETAAGKITSVLDDQAYRGRLVGEVLSDAVTVSTKQDRRALARSLTPSIEDAIQESVDTNPGFLAGTLFPVIMPAVRRAITAALEQLVERVNRTIQHRFSLQSLRWRFQALRAGVAYPEYLLAKTLEYRVEQVFLIHRPSGILLLHVASDPRTSQDADIIGSMLTAIQDFVHDSFGVPDEEALETMEVGDLKVWVERTSHAALAAVIRGSPPHELRNQLQETSEALLVRHYQELVDFDGDSTAFAPDSPLLERCLRSRYRDAQESGAKPGGIRRFVRWAFVLILFLAALYPLLIYARTTWRWNQYIDALAELPGIVVAEQDRLRVSGLKDPLAEDPVSILEQFRLDSTNVSSTWISFRNQDPSFEGRRAIVAIRPPESVAASIDTNVVRLSGEASLDWIAGAQTIMRAFPSLSLDDTALRVSITDEILDLQESIRGFNLRFPEGQALPARGQQETLAQLMVDVESVGRALKAIGRGIEIVISGHASAEGSDEFNMMVSQRRAERIRELLISTGVDTTTVHLEAVGLGASSPVSTGNASRDRIASRRVTLEATINDR